VVIPGTRFPDDPEIHLEKQKKIWAKVNARLISVKLSQKYHTASFFHKAQLCKYPTFQQC
jgi:hypothetical protein